MKTLRADTVALLRTLERDETLYDREKIWLWAWEVLNYGHGRSDELD